jgi:hypothetical protein
MTLPSGKRLIVLVRVGNAAHHPSQGAAGVRMDGPLTIDAGPPEAGAHS